MSDSSQTTFDIAINDEVTQQTYIGKFTVRCFLSPLEVIKADRLYRELIGPVNSMMASTDAQNFAFAIAQLSVRIVESAEFFKNTKNPEFPGGHLPSKVLIGILNKAVEAEEKFYDKQQKRMEAITKKLTNGIKSGKIKKKVEDPEEEESAEQDDNQDPEVELG